MPFRKVLRKIRRGENKHNNPNKSSGVDNEKGAINNGFMSDSSKLYLTCLLSLLIGVLIGLFASQTSLIDSLFPERFNNSNISKAHEMFTTEVGDIKGRVIRVSGGILRIKNINNIEGDFPTSNNFTIVKVDANEGIPRFFNDLKEIELNKDGNISLELIDNQYRVKSIEYEDETKDQSRK